MGKKEIEAYPEVTGQVPGSWAHFTIYHRLPKILDQVIGQNDFDRKTVRGLQALKDETTAGVVKPFASTFPDQEYWLDFLAFSLGKHWQEAPYYAVEAYFYRRIAEATGFFDNHLDPFQKTKNAEISRNPGFFEKALKNQQSANGDFSNQKRLKQLLMLTLWGNKSDLSQVQMEGDGGLSALQKISAEQLLINDAQAVIALLSSKLERVDFVLDNAGVELFSDLLLADCLLSQGLAQTVHFHAKACPTFVSDATLQDIEFLLDFLGNLASAKAFIGRLQGFHQSGKLVFNEHFFWNAPLHFYDMPPDLTQELARSSLVIFKGDANYRRLLGDKQLPVELTAWKLSGYLPAPAVGIRTLKSELIIGLDKHQADQLDADDPDWKTNGDYGVIQAFGPWS